MSKSRSTAVEMWRQHLRLTMLRVLAELPDVSANESILHDAVKARMIRADRDQVRKEIQWLAKEELVTAEELDGMLLAMATERGCEVAQGKAVHSGVKRPSTRR